MIQVIKDPEQPENDEVLADSIIHISHAFVKLQGMGITEKGIIALLKDMRGMQGVGKREIGLVLQNLRKLKDHYIKKS